MKAHLLWRTDFIRRCGPKKCLFYVWVLILVAWSRVFFESFVRGDTNTFNFLLPFYPGLRSLCYEYWFSLQQLGGGECGKCRREVYVNPLHSFSNTSRFFVEDPAEILIDFNLTPFTTHTQQKYFETPLRRGFLTCLLAWWKLDAPDKH